MIRKVAKVLSNDERDENEWYNNHKDMYHFLSLPMKPGILEVVEVAWMLGLKPHNIRALVTGKFLTPIGRPAQQDRKQFCVVQIEALRLDTKWKGEALVYVRERWRKKNRKAKQKRLLEKGRSEEAE